ncbi:MerR family DNA-binding transcriptional regulator [Kitasatospora sp. NPDC088160]|uniref:MerR family DNA-binding transcriptional regulator n=1 Tax=Kitasatospora sp. NPDC088160 TaxID=3364072 RepID=UPI003809DF43
MSWSAGQVSRFAGVTVRTPHHYDRSGLLPPNDRSRPVTASTMLRTSPGSS